MLDCEAWRLLWIPPAWPYYKPEGEFARPGAQNLTKRLIFSSWQVVPKVVAALLTYEAERRMLGVSPEGEAGGQGPEARKKRRGLLRFSESKGRLTGMAVLGLMYPSSCWPRKCDPLAWTAPSGASILPTSKKSLIALAGSANAYSTRSQRTRRLTGPRTNVGIGLRRSCLISKRDGPSGQGHGSVRRTLQPSGAGPNIAPAAADDVDPEGARDRQLRGQSTSAPHGRSRIVPLTWDVCQRSSAMSWQLNANRRSLCDGAPCSRAVAGGLQRVAETSLRNQAAQVAEGLRSLFNQPEVTTMVRREASRRRPGPTTWKMAGARTTRSEKRHWRRVLAYWRTRRLQAVLDEYAHVLVEHLGVSGRPTDKIEQEVSAAMREA